MSAAIAPTVAGRRLVSPRPRQWRCAPPRPTTAASASAAGGTVTATSASGVSADSLASLVAEKEAKLQGLFEPGRVQPKAAEVAGLRKEIAALRAQLQAQLGIGGGVAAVGSSRPGPAHAHAPAQAAAASAPSVVEKRLLDALKLAEAQLAVSRQASPGSLGQLSPEDQQELLRLQDENSALKSQLDFIQARQAQLQLLWDQHVGTSASHASQQSHSASAVPPRALQQAAGV